MVYGQLILENAKLTASTMTLVDQIFDFMVRDFSKYALQLYCKPSSTPAQMELCLKMIRKPVVGSRRGSTGCGAGEVYALRDSMR